MKGLNLDHLRTLADVVARGSFSAAAKAQGLTQPAISLQVRQLERRFATRLVERVGRQVMPTASGTALLAHVAHIEAAVQGATDAMTARASTVAGRVSIGTGATACTYLLPPLLAELRRRYPALDVVVRTGNTDDMLQALAQNTLDVALVTLPVRGRMFEVTPLLEDEFVAISPKNLPLPARVTAAALSRVPLVLFEPGARTRHLVDDWFARADAVAQPSMSLGSVEAIKELVRAGLGCGVLPKMALGGPRAGSKIDMASLSPRLHRTLGIVVRRDKPLNRGLQEVLNALRRLKDGN
ncbi:LysR family transcriptional regulator [Alcaligenaceae bacterium B3P038]|nr:LysR family transcriptional regulator [Alcaligenaceae bacterium B3P038]